MIKPLLSTLLRSSEEFFIRSDKNLFCYLIPVIFLNFIPKWIKIYLIIFSSNLTYWLDHFLNFFCLTKHKDWNYRAIGVLSWKIWLILSQSWGSLIMMKFYHVLYIFLVDIGINNDYPYKYSQLIFVPILDLIVLVLMTKSKLKKSYFFWTERKIYKTLVGASFIIL